MNVLEVLTAAANELGIPAPAAYGSDTQLLNLLYAVSRMLRNTKVFTEQKRTFTISTAASTSTYALPADFYSPILLTHYDQTRKWSMIGPVSDADFNFKLYGPGATSSVYTYRIFGPNIQQYSSAKMLEIDPTPSAIDTLSFDYITMSMFYPSGWTPGVTIYETVTADTHISMFDDDVLIMGLKYLYREAKGLDYEVFKNQFTRMIERAQTRYMGSFKGSFKRQRQGRRYRPTEGDGGWTI